MATRLQPRQSYQNDAAFMLKLGDLIERDERITSSDRQKAIIQLKTVAVLLANLNLAKGHHER